MFSANCFCGMTQLRTISKFGGMIMVSNYSVEEHLGKTKSSRVADCVRMTHRAFRFRMLLTSSLFCFYSFPNVRRKTNWKGIVVKDRLSGHLAKKSVKERFEQILLCMVTTASR